MEWWRKRLYLLILALLLWGTASGIGVWNQKTARHWQVVGLNSQDQAGRLSQQGNLVTASGAQTSESVPSAANPSSPNPVYSSTGFFHTSSDPQRSVVLRWPSISGASSSSDVPSSSVQMSTSSPGSSQYVAVSQQAPSSQSQNVPVSQHQTVNKPSPQVSMNLGQSVAQDQGNLGAQVPGSSSTSRWGSVLVLSQGTNQTAYKPVSPAQSSASAVVPMGQGSLVSQSRGFRWPTTSASVDVHEQVPASPNVTLTQSTYKPLAPAQASGASAVVSMGQAQSTSSSRWPTFSGSSRLLSQTRGTSQNAVGALTQAAYKPVVPSQTSSQSTVGSQDQVRYGAQSMGSSRWSTSTGSTSSQLPSQAQGTSRGSGGSLTQMAFKPVFPSSDATTFSGSLGRYGVQSTVSSWPTSSGSVSPPLVSQRVSSQYGSVLGAQTNVPSSPAHVSSAATVVSRDQSWSASSSLSSQLLSQTQGTSRQMVYKPVIPSQGSSLSTIVSQAQGSGAQSSGFGWSASGPVSSQLSAQGTSSQYVSRFVTLPNVPQLPSSISSQSVVSQDRVSYGAQSTGSRWSTSGQLGVQSPSQGQAVVSLAQTSSDSMPSQGSSGSQASSHATWHRVPSSAFRQSNTPVPQYGRVTFNVPSASEAYSSLVSTLHTSAASSVSVSRPQVPQSGPVASSTQYGDALVSKGTRFSAARSRGPSVGKLQVLQQSSPVSMDISANQLTSGSSSLYSGSQGYSFAPTMTLPSFLRPAPWRSSDPPVSMGKQ